MIAAFGEQTAEAIIQAGFKLNIHAPQPQAPSMAMALEQYLKGEQTNNPWQQAPLSSMAKNQLAHRGQLPKPKVNTEGKKPGAGKTMVQVQQTVPVVKAGIKPKSGKPAKKPIATLKQQKPVPAKPKPVQKKPEPGKKVNNIAIGRKNEGLAKQHILSKHKTPAVSKKKSHTSKPVKRKPSKPKSVKTKDRHTKAKSIKQKPKRKR